MQLYQRSAPLEVYDVPDSCHRPVPNPASRVAIVVKLLEPRACNPQEPSEGGRATQLPNPSAPNGIHSNLASATTSPATPRTAKALHEKQKNHAQSLPSHGTIASASHDVLCGDELLDRILNKAEWAQVLGTGAVGMVLVPRCMPHVAIKVSMYETGFRTPLFTHPTRSEPAMMRLLMKTLIAGRATPHLPVLLSERHDVSLHTLYIPEMFWRSSTAAVELRQWIDRRRNCDPNRCSVLCMERFAGGTLFHALCRGTAPGVDIFAVRELAFQIIYTLAVVLRFQPDWKHNDLSLANVMLRRRGSLKTTRLDTRHLLVHAGWASSPVAIPWNAAAQPSTLVPEMSSDVSGNRHYRRYEFEGVSWFLPLRPEQPFEAVIADFDFACIHPLISNAKVDFFERQSTYQCYRINSQRDWYGDIQMMLSNLREVVHHLIRRRLDAVNATSRSIRADHEQGRQSWALLPEEQDAVEFFERRVHPSCRDTQDRSLRGRLPPSALSIGAQYGPVEMLLNDPYFDCFRQPPNWDAGAILDESFVWPISDHRDIDEAVFASDAPDPEGASWATFVWSSSSPIHSEWECSRDSCAADGA
jgi:hypothetical protein